MKQLLLVFALLLPAELYTAQSAYGANKDLAYRAQTLLRDDSGEHLSLCALVETRSALIVNFWRKAQTYALATNHCDTEQYYTFSVDDLAQARGAGNIIEEVPSLPELTVMETFGGFWGWGLVPVLGTIISSRLVRRPKMKRRRRRQVDTFSHRAAQVMTLTASALGDVLPPQIVRIRQMLHNLTGADVPEHLIHEILQTTAMPQHDADFKQLGAGMAAGERDDLVKAALMIVADREDFSEDVLRFLAGLHMELGVTGARFNEMVNILFAPRPATN